MKNILWLVMGGLVWLAACQAQPQFKNHVAPELSVDFSRFADVGCPPDQYGFRECNPDSPLAALECDAIREPSNLLGGLEPAYPITLCLVQPYRDTQNPGLANAEMIAAGEYFYNSGGLVPNYVRYVIFREGQFQLLKTEAEFRAVFAPVESTGEALSYVLAVKNLDAYYGLEHNPKYVYFTGALEDTHVEPVTDGYRVHLFYYEVFGCGPHTTSAVEIHISFEGVLKEVSRQPVFKNPADDGLCVD